MISWQKTDRHLILASASPRRKQILELMGLSFSVIVPETIDESNFLDKNDLQGTLQNLALIKAETVAKHNPGCLVLGADTIVVKNNFILGKPKNREDAHNTLNFLSNSSHSVMTGVALRCIDANFTKTTVCCTDVYFRDISDSEINRYLDSDEYKDKAGSYAIQGQGLIFIEKISGCYYNVVGLPVTSTINLFNDFIARKESADV